MITNVFQMQCILWPRPAPVQNSPGGHLPHPTSAKQCPHLAQRKATVKKKRNKNFSQCRQYKLHLTFSIKSVSRTFGIVWRTGIFGKNLRLEPQRSTTVKQGQNDMPFRTRLLGTESWRLQNQSKSATKMCLLVDFKLISSWLHLEWNWLNDCIVLICLVLLMASPLYAIVTSFVTYCDRQYGLCFALLRFASVLCFRALLPSRNSWCMLVQSSVRQASLAGWCQGRASCNSIRPWNRLQTSSNCGTFE